MSDRFKPGDRVIIAYKGKSWTSNEYYGKKAIVVGPLGSLSGALYIKIDDEGTDKTIQPIWSSELQSYIVKILNEVLDE